MKKISTFILIFLLALPLPSCAKKVKKKEISSEEYKYNFLQIVRQAEKDTQSKHLEVGVGENQLGMPLDRLTNFEVKEKFKSKMLVSLDLLEADEHDGEYFVVIGRRGFVSSFFDIEVKIKAKEELEKIIKMSKDEKNHNFLVIQGTQVLNGKNESKKILKAVFLNSYSIPKKNN